MRPGDVVLAKLQGVLETKVRPAVVIASDAYLREHLDVIVGILTTKFPARVTSTDYVLVDWQAASLRAPSCFRAFVLTFPQSEAVLIGHLTPRDLAEVQLRVRAALAL